MEFDGCSGKFFPVYPLIFQKSIYLVFLFRDSIVSKVKRQRAILMTSTFSTIFTNCWSNDGLTKFLRNWLSVLFTFITRENVSFNILSRVFVYTPFSAESFFNDIYVVDSHAAFNIKETGCMAVLNLL